MAVELEGKSAIVVLDVLSKCQPATLVRMFSIKTLIEEGVRAYTDLVFFMYNENSSYMKGLVGFPFIKILILHVYARLLALSFEVSNRHRSESTKLYFTLGDLDYF